MSVVLAILAFLGAQTCVHSFYMMVPGGNNGVVRPGRCGAQSAVLGPEGREMKFSKKI